MNNIVDKLDEKLEKLADKVVGVKEEKEEVETQKPKSYVLSSVYPSKEIQDKVKYYNNRMNLN